MIDSILRADKEYNLFDGVTDITVAVSGGADSVALLHALNAIKDNFGFSLTVAHYHHGIRGAEADRDQDFVRDFAKSLGLPFVTEKGDAVGYSKKTGMSLETAARELRYDFLSRVSKGIIATAHNANDNIETILFNITRGASLNGICGIPPKRENIIRPLIFCERESIEEYCRVNDLSFVTDSTNLVDDCSRNLIRHKVVPVLREINSACLKNASNLSRTLNEDNSFIEDLSYIEFNKRFVGKKLDLTGFCELHKSIAKRVLINYYKSCFGTLPDLYHIERIYDVASGKIIRTSVSFDKSAKISGGYLVFSDCQPENRDFSVETTKISIEEFQNIKNVHGLLAINAIDCDKIVGEIGRIEKSNSDTIKLANSGVTKTVKKLLTEKKIPLEYRKNLPVFADKEGIIWIYGVGVADRVKVDKSTKVVLCISPTVL